MQNDGDSETVLLWGRYEVIGILFYRVTVGARSRKGDRIREAFV